MYFYESLSKVVLLFCARNIRSGRLKRASKQVLGVFLSTYMRANEKLCVHGTNNLLFFSFFFPAEFDLGYQNHIK